MDLAQHDSLDVLRLVALGSPLPARLPSPPSSLSKPALVRSDLASLEKFITSHFNSLLGTFTLTQPMEEITRGSANIGLTLFSGLPLLDCPISRWNDLPRVLANIQQYIDGVPPVCIPIVDENDRITNDIHTWSEEQLSAMHHALNGFTIRACPRPAGEYISSCGLCCSPHALFYIG